MMRLIHPKNLPASVFACAFAFFDQPTDRPTDSLEVRSLVVVVASLTNNFRLLLDTFGRLVAHLFPLTLLTCAFRFYRAKRYYLSAFSSDFLQLLLLLRLSFTLLPPLNSLSIFQMSPPQSNRKPVPIVILLFAQVNPMLNGRSLGCYR